MIDTIRDRRVFFSAGSESWQIFTISQNLNDGSIYFSAPAFAEMDWLVPVVELPAEPHLLSFKAGADGKLSLHGSGVTHVRPHGSYGSNNFVVRGVPLKNPEDGSLGVRHLFTLFLSEPKHKPVSPGGARKSDYTIATAKEKQPLVLVFWAIPLFAPGSVGITGSFHEDDLESVPPESGWGGFSMRLHSIIWFGYRTKYMDRWPLYSQACYLDGYVVPLLISTAPGSFRLELKRPQYSLTGNDFDINM